MSTDTSIVYKNIHLYRAIMNLLYTGSYRKRFSVIENVIAKEKPSSILELCFGDVYIAKYCKQHNIQWMGLDINQSFVDYAVQNNFNAKCVDLVTIKELDKSGMVIISGSLYHFAPQHTDALFTKILQSTGKILISEPVQNLSSKKGFIGYLARRSANAGKGNEEFRYNEESFNKDIDSICLKFNLDEKLIGFLKKDMIVLLTKR